MPPEDAEIQLADNEKARIVDWLSREIQVASQVRRSEKQHTSFRRMTRYEYKYAIQDLLNLPMISLEIYLQRQLQKTASKIVLKCCR